MSNGPKRFWRGRIMKQSLTTTGYMRVNLTTPNTCQQKVRKVHVLMLEAFHGAKPSPSAVGRHLNDIRTDNRIENLAWGSYGDNMRDMIRNGTHHNARKTHCIHGHEFTPENTGANTGNNRSCKTCTSIRSKKRYARLKAERET